MRILLNIVSRNEENRYLKEFFQWHSWIFDDISCFDDQSEDNTASIAEKYGAKVKIRPGNKLSFQHNESQFRFASWEWMAEALHPTEADWVMALDCDEMLVGSNNARQTTLLCAAAIKAENKKSNSVILPIPEVFNIDEKKDLYIRKDGFWDNLKQPRFCKYNPKFSWNNKPMACGSLPTYAYENPSDENCGLSLLHLGYARQEDRNIKHER